jgi:HTH-type transcriptional regulator/antitoxin HigA
MYRVPRDQETAFKADYFQSNWCLQGRRKSSTSGTSPTHQELNMDKKRTPAEVFHPGSFIKAEMFARGWSIETMCQRSGIRRDVIEEILAEKRPVTPVFAFCLATAFGTGHQVWSNLQKSFDEFTKR